MANGFTANAVLLRRECQRNEGGGEELGGRAGEGIQAAMANVLNPEKIIRGSARGAAVFAGAKKK